MQSLKDGPALLDWKQWETVTIWVMKNKDFIAEADNQGKLIELACKPVYEGGCPCRTANLYSFLEIIKSRDLEVGWGKLEVE